MLLFFDTETTGIHRSAHIVQLAALMTEDDGTTRGSCNFIIKPEGYTIPEEASNIHGITTEIASRCGVPLATAISAFNNLALQCEKGVLVAHNIRFDINVMDYACQRNGWPSRIVGMERFCTMEQMRDKVKLPPTPRMVAAGIREYKSPKLSEAYQFAFDKPFENAHDALYDVHGCKDLYFWLQHDKEKPQDLPF